MMIRSILHFSIANIALLLVCCQCVALQTVKAQRAVALRGLDPTQLVSGKEVEGNEAYSSDYGRFRYLFASATNRDLFESKPDQFAVRGNGCSAVKTWMPGDPAKFYVRNGKIFLVDSDDSLNEMKKNPDPLVKALEERKRVAIMLFPGVQIIDYSGPYEVFGEAGYEVYTVAASTEPLLANMFQTVIPTYTFDKCPKPDIVVVPGGNVPKADRADPRIQWILGNAGAGTEILSVCNGSFWLANAGLLDGKKATTYYGLLDSLKQGYPKVDVVSDSRFADNGQIICTAGLSSGIDGALHVVEKLDGKGAAQYVALNMEYNWQPDGTFFRGDFADKYLRRAVGRNFDFGDGSDSNILEMKGDRDWWDQSWEIKSPNITAKDYMANLSKKLASGWKLVSSDSGDTESTKWAFDGEDGKAWSAEATVRSDANRSLVLHLTMRHS